MSAPSSDSSPARRHASALAWAAAALTASVAATAAPAETTSTAEQRRAVSVTIYNESLALVREERELELQQGLNRVALREVSAQIRPETASLRSLSGGALSLLEQNFDFDLLSPQALLDKHVGQSVTILTRNPQTGAETRETATVLANNQEPVLQYADRVEAGLPEHARIVYGALPRNLRDRPTLVVDVHAPQAGKRLADLSYLTGGLSWKADYVATLAPDEKTLDLAGWVTLTNQSGASYDNARLQLVAGDVNRVAEMDNRQRFRAMESVVMAAAPAPMAQEELFEYHLYTLGRPTDLRNNQTKQVALLHASKVPVDKEYRLQGAQHWYQSLLHNDNLSLPEKGDERKVSVFLQFKNSGGELGVPLPKGVVRVYKDDSSQRSLFVGEDRIDHTARNDDVRLRLGNAFDVNGNWKHTHTRRIGKNEYEASFTIDLRNAKDQPVSVNVVEPVPGSWSILKESHPSTKPTANLAQWKIRVPANGSTQLGYTVRVKL